MGKEFTPPEFLIIGRVIAPWGTKGELKVQVITDFPDRFTLGKVVYIGGEPLEIENSRPHRQHLLIKLAGTEGINDAEKLRGQDITIPRSDIRALPPEQYYVFQLIGLDVLTTGGKSLGQIVDVLPTAGNDVYIVKSERGEILIPAIEDVIMSIDLENRQVIIEVIEGLLPSS